MGNSTSNPSRISKKSESMEIRAKPAKETSSEFCKSKSMMDMSSSKGSKSSSSSGTTSRQKSIVSIKDKEKPKGSSKTNEVSRQKSIRRDAAHPISNQGRDIISQCFENPHSEFANKVVQRIFEKRDDYQNFIVNIGKDRSYRINSRLKSLIEDIVAHINDSEFIENVSRHYGEEHVELKQYGFKPDFWVAIADAMTLEGVILDMANHQPADTVSAWSSLVTMIFSSVRDGYYSELRRHRMSSRRTLKHQSTVDSREDNNNDVRQNETVIPKDQQLRTNPPLIEEAPRSLIKSVSKKLVSQQSMKKLATTPTAVISRTGSPYSSRKNLADTPSTSSTTISRRPVFE